MTERYKTACAPGQPALMLIFAEGTWDQLPYEVRLLRPWYPGEICDSKSLTARQKLEVRMVGYSVTKAPRAQRTRGAKLRQLRRRTRKLSKSA